MNKNKSVRFAACVDGHSRGDLSRIMRDESPCVFLSLNFKLQTNNFKQTAHKGNHQKKKGKNP